PARDRCPASGLGMGKAGASRRVALSRTAFFIRRSLGLRDARDVRFTREAPRACGIATKRVRLTLQSSQSLYEVASGMVQNPISDGGGQSRCHRGSAAAREEAAAESRGPRVASPES